MIAGIIMGIGIGLVVAVCIFARLIISSNKRAQGNGDRVLQLLEEKSAILGGILHNIIKLVEVIK